jgi:hypothetical protein
VSRRYDPAVAYEREQRRRVREARAAEVVARRADRERVRQHATERQADSANQNVDLADRLAELI